MLHPKLLVCLYYLWFVYIYIYIYILHPQTLIYLFNQLILEQLHQSMQNFCLFCQKKPTFSILHTNFYKILTSVCLFYNLFYLNNHFPKFFNYLSQLSLSLSLSIHSLKLSLSIPHLKLSLHLWSQAMIHHGWNWPIHKHRFATSTNPKRFVPVYPNIPISSKHQPTATSSQKCSLTLLMCPCVGVFDFWLILWCVYGWFCGVFDFLVDF